MTNNDNYGIWIGCCVYCIRALIMQCASFSDAIKMYSRLTFTEGGERLLRPTWIFGSFLKADKIMDQEAAAEFPIVLPAQRGLQYCIG